MCPRRGRRSSKPLVLVTISFFYRNEITKKNNHTLTQIGGSLTAPSNHVLVARAVQNSGTAATASVGTAASVDTTVSAGTTASMSTATDSVPEDLTSTITTTIHGVNSAFGDASGRLNKALGEFGDHVTTFLRNSGSTALDLGSGYADTAQQLVGTGSRATQALGKMFSRLFTGFGSTVSNGGSGYGSGYGSTGGAGGFGFGFGSNGGFGTAASGSGNLGTAASGSGSFGTA